MPRDTGLPPGTLMMLVLRVLSRQPLHGYAIAQHIHHLSNEQLSVEEGSLYPALQKLLIKGWVKAAWRESESGRQVRLVCGQVHSSHPGTCSSSHVHDSPQPREV